MTIIEWTLWVVGIGLTLIAMLFAIFSYLNKRGHRKIITAKKSFGYGLLVMVFVYFLALLFFVEWDTKEKPATKNDFERLKADILSTLIEPTHKEVESEIDKEFKDKFGKKKKKALEEYQKGLVAYKKDEFEVAINHFDKAAKIFAIPSFYIYRGITYILTSRFDRALDDFDKAVQLDPNCANSYNNRGTAWYQKGDFDKALDDFDKAVQLNPNFAVAYNNRGAAWYQKGDFDKALADSTKAIQLNPNFAVAYYYRGSTHLKLGHGKEAAQDFKHYLNLRIKCNCEIMEPVL